MFHTKMAFVKFSCLTLLLQCYQILSQDIADPYIIGGETTTGRPLSIYQVFITDVYRRNCSGALLRPNWIITSAECAGGKHADYTNLRYIAGTDNLEGAEENYVERVFIHPSFNTRTLDNDLALIKIPPVSNSAGLIPIIASPQRNYYDHWATVSGWGKSNEEISMQLTTRTVLIANNDECRKMHYPTTNTKKMCTRGAYACPADIGGPLVLQLNPAYPYLIGVVSGASNTMMCDRTWATQYTNVGIYKNWIINTMNKN